MEAEKVKSSAMETLKSSLGTLRKSLNTITCEKVLPLQKDVSWISRHVVFAKDHHDSTTDDTEITRCVFPPYFRTSCNPSDISYVAPMPPLPDKNTMEIIQSNLHPHEWNAMELLILKICALRAYFHRIIFYYRGRMMQKYREIGLDLEDIHKLELLWRSFDDRLWKIAYLHWTQPNRVLGKKYEEVLDEYFVKNRKYLTELMIQREKNRNPIQDALTVARCKNNVVAKMKSTTLFQLHHAQLKRFYLLRYQNDHTIPVKEVDWMMVSADMSKVTARKLSPEQCRRMYWFERQGAFKNIRVSRLCIKKMKQLMAQPRFQITNERPHSSKDGSVEYTYDWNAISKELTEIPSSLRTFQTYRKFISKRPDLFTRRQKEYLINSAYEYNNILPLMAKKVLKKYRNKDMECFKRLWLNSNPNYAKGYFSLAEDALMLVSIVLHSKELKGVEEIFYGVFETLPWRYSWVWKSRATKLLAIENSSWTINEDKLLLLLVKKYGLGYAGLPYILKKPMSKCVQRYNILKEELKVMSLEEIQVKRKSKNTVYSYMERLEDVLFLLSKTISSKLGQSKPITSKNITNYILKSTSKVSNLSMQRVKKKVMQSFACQNLSPHLLKVYLTTFPADVLVEAFINLFTKLSFMSDYAEAQDSISDTGRVKCNRRKFNVDDPVSIASALHLRGICLKEKTLLEWRNMNHFLKQIYGAYRKFEVSSNVKMTTYRSTLPTKLELCLIPILKDIIEVPGDIKSRLCKQCPEKIALRLTWNSSTSPTTEMMRESSNVFFPATNEVKKAVTKLKYHLGGPKPSKGKNRKVIKKQQMREAANARWKKEKNFTQTNENDGQNKQD